MDQGIVALLSGFALCLALILSIGAQNAVVLRQGLRREHVGLDTSRFRAPAIPGGRNDRQADLFA